MKSILKVILSFFTVVAIFGCSTTPPVLLVKPYAETAEARRNLLVGHWYSEAPTNEGGKQMKIAERHADGSFKIRFRNIDRAGKASEVIEVGYWGISGPVYFTITLGTVEGLQFFPFDTTKAYFNDAYEILNLDEQNFRYRSYAYGVEYINTKVSDAYIFPE